MLVVIAVSVVIGSCSEETRQEIFGAARLVPTARVDATLHTVEGTDASGSLLPYIPQPDELSLTLSNSDGSYSHTWTHLSEYPANEPLLTGLYKAEVSYGSELVEGVDSPYFYGAESVSLSADGVTESVCVTATLANTMWRIATTDAFAEYFGNAVATLHSAGGGYIAVNPAESAPVFLRTGDVCVYLELEMPTGERVEFLAAKVTGAKAARLYDITLDQRMASDGVTPQVVVSFDESTATDDVVITLSREFLDAEAPTLEALGFAGGETIAIAEGTTTDNPVCVKVKPSLTSRLLMTSKSPSLVAAGWPAEIDLMEVSAAQLSVMRDLGLKISDDTDGSRCYDFTDVLRHLRASDTGPVAKSFSFIASSASGRIAGPLTLNVEVSPVDISIVGVSPVVIGVNQAQVRILSRDANLEQNLSVQIRSSQNKSWEPAAITSITPDSDRTGRWYVKFEVPQSTDPTVEARILYCSQVKAQYTLRRVAPSYTVEVDGYAMLAIVKISAESEDMTSMIASTANVYLDGAPTVQVSRDPDRGYIIVGALEPNHTYNLTTTLYDTEGAAAHPGGFTSVVRFATENNPGVPNGTFDQILADQIKYRDLPAGGRFSQNIVDLFNRQNYVSYNLAVPKGWANTNSKTFCTAASRHNSWYMVPSVYTIKDVVTEESPYAVVVRSTGWDLHGAAIPDYRQTGQPYTDYSLSIPEIAHRSAGKLFLGSYTFNPATETETYREGVEFHSRPTALNGYYSFIPALNDIYDRGLAIVEVIGEEANAEVVIARGEYLFTAATSYTAFSIPLTYRYFGRKATKLKILFSSSERIGSIAEETADVVTYSDPKISMSIGNELRLDNLTFSY
ncbi:MAG: DUF4493 domain-containing protein [Paramuribaculum sp.]|nr:DUF4493 domain-containing protein [Paramuribaculum sp.]